MVIEIYAVLAVSSILQLVILMRLIRFTLVFAARFCVKNWHLLT